MKTYKINLDVLDEIIANDETEAEIIFWDRFDNSVWKPTIKEIPNIKLHKVEMKDGTLFIDDVEINEEVYQKELSEYWIVDREDQIEQLKIWIREAIQNRDRRGDLYLMEEDLDYLKDLNDELIFSSYSTNDYIAKSDNPERWNEICEDILEKNSEVCKDLYKKGKLDYCEGCEAYINQIDLGDGSFGCPICETSDSILTKYDSEVND